MGKIMAFPSGREISEGFARFLQVKQATTHEAVHEYGNAAEEFAADLTVVAAELDKGTVMAGYALVVDWMDPEGIRRFMRYNAPIGLGHLSHMAATLSQQDKESFDIS